VKTTTEIILTPFHFLVRLQMGPGS